MTSRFVTYQWEVFISLEVLSSLFLIAFLLLRYAFSKVRLSRWFLGLFLLTMIIEAALAWLVYNETGEISNFQIVVGIFLIYAVTFGINDFKKLDRYIKEKVGKWRGVQLLTEKDIEQMERAKDPAVIARKNRLWWYIHASIFIVVHYMFWLNVGDQSHSFIYYLTDFSWFANEGAEGSPYTHETIAQISKVWSVVFAIDTIASWSYTVFPDQKKSV
ncbi:hypothetical protein JNUCC1_02143 [Lentibacillus sp. JNUCC-1]|uniref:hypothetical protein n=1 Tax=Lentibacillus sp. JNUCC-1 TaxID=2654513 RepID=UPI00132A255F|nr:hypothetical protein [Lentibacillus sp. JNUCC-1]MUV38305.1 hypothetical protein [Lentibacillus sp. JNUCC-1]